MIRKSGRSDKNGISSFIDEEEYFKSILQQLMPFQVRNVLIVANRYDYYILEEDGRIVDLLKKSYQSRDLGYIPMLYMVDSYDRALEEVDNNDYDLVINIIRFGEGDPIKFGQDLKKRKPDLPLVFLAYSTPELQKMLNDKDIKTMDHIFMWQGDGKVLVGIIQFIEDMKNACHDTEIAGVQNIIVIEDSIDFYSTYLPIIFEELWHQTNQLLEENLTYTQKLLRQKARPKILHATNFEKAVELFDRFKSNLLGVITDISFPRDGKIDQYAGIKFLQMIIAENKKIPVLIQSANPNVREIVSQYDASFLNKSSPSLVQDFREYLMDLFGFGPIIFRSDDGSVKAIAHNFVELVSAIDQIPGQILRRYLLNGDLLRWIRARTELILADRIEKLQLRDEPDAEKIREKIQVLLTDFRKQSHRGHVLKYSRQLYRDYVTFSRIGGGSIGGKARGLTLIDKVISNLNKKYNDLDISIPRSLILGTDLFDDFLRSNDLNQYTLTEDTKDEEIAKRFIKSDLDKTVINELRDYLDIVRVPLAVRSSSLLEDSLYQPFVGIYMTKMIPNSSGNMNRRLKDLINAVKLVYASTFFKQARWFISNTINKIEEEKMAVIIQEVVGGPHGNRFYPDISGVAKSYNYYPVSYAKPEDGIAQISLGLGKNIVDGGLTVDFAPPYPKILPAMSTIKDLLNNTQREFWAIDLHERRSSGSNREDEFLLKLRIEDAAQDNILTLLASTYSAEDDAVFDGTSRDGIRLITFANILKNDQIPLSSLIVDLLKACEDKMGCPVAIEFASSIGYGNRSPNWLGFLQIRPLVISDELVEVDIENAPVERQLCYSDKVLGNGIIENIEDIIIVKDIDFTASNSIRIAEEVARFNSNLINEGCDYLLIGPGRWGSTEPWLGIPVKWMQINGAKTIIELAREDLKIDPSQGSHFFHNITSLGLGYFTIKPGKPNNFINNDWLKKQPFLNESDNIVHIRLDSPLKIIIDGRKGLGIILKS